MSADLRTHVVYMMNFFQCVFCYSKTILHDIDMMYILIVWEWICLHMSVIILAVVFVIYLMSKVIISIDPYLMTCLSYKVLVPLLQKITLILPCYSASTLHPSHNVYDKKIV